MAKLKTNIYFKLGIILVLVLILLIPTKMVENLIKEREGRQSEAIDEVSDKWGKGQTLTGPFLSIPYDKYVKRYKRDTLKEIVKVRAYIHILPEYLQIGGELSPERRYRSIYEVVVYESNLSVKGRFKPLDLKQFEINPKDIHLDKAVLNLGITDLKGIEKQVVLKWNERTIAFNSGVSTKNVIASGINARLPKLKPMEDYTFFAELDLKGSQYLYFVPVGKTTDVNLTSNWQTPSFTGMFLPDRREISEAGFSANWNVLHLNRNYPQAWLGSSYGIRYSAFGTDLLLPVDKYKKSNRVAKYAILFLVLTYTVFFFVEVLNRVFIHPIQYLLVGFALVMFYTLLLSFSEHMIFNLAYLIAMILTLCLITGYTISILKSKRIGLMILGILFIFYLFIFTIIQLENYALLIGSIGIFLILASVMYFSRKIDWYKIRIGEGKEAKD